MPKSEIASKINSDWKDRYSKLYSTHHMFRTQEEEPRRISFMSVDSTPYTSLLMRMRATNRDSLTYGCDVAIPPDINTRMSQRSEFYDRIINSDRSDDLGGNDTLLLDMVRARSRELEEEAQDKTLELPGDDVSDDQSSEACVHGLGILNMRMTERSVSRSRVSRISTRRDMDIPSILAFEIPVTPAPVPLEIPGLRKVNPSPNENIPRWSIRRSICPVCSQKWRDKSSINNVKYSGWYFFLNYLEPPIAVIWHSCWLDARDAAGYTLSRCSNDSNDSLIMRCHDMTHKRLKRLKRNSSAELPSVIAPARLRASITMAYAPRPFPATVDESKGIGRAMRNSSAAWQLTRARRFRIPKLQMPSPEAIAPLSSTAPMARKDLDIRVNRFLRDEGMTKNVTT